MGGLYNPVVHNLVILTYYYYYRPADYINQVRTYITSILLPHIRSYICVCVYFQYTLLELIGIIYVYI